MCCVLLLSSELKEQGLSQARRGSFCSSVERSSGGLRSCHTCSHLTRWCFACRLSTSLGKQTRSSRRRVMRALLPRLPFGSDRIQLRAKCWRRCMQKTRRALGLGFGTQSHTRQATGLFRRAATQPSSWTARVHSCWHNGTAPVVELELNIASQVNLPLARPRRASGSSKCTAGVPSRGGD